MKRIQETATFIIANIELKNISTDSLSLYKNNTDLVFPTRVWDSYRLWGDSKMDSMVREIISAEIINNPHLVQKFSDRLRSHAHITKTG